MRLKKKSLIGMGLVAGVMAFMLLSGSTLLAAGNQPPLNVEVLNTPLPVTGSVEVTGSTSVSGSVDAAQSGTWTVGIDPNNNQVSLAPGESLYYNPGFNVIGGGNSSIDLGPFDCSKLSKLRIIARAFNNNGGDIKFEVLVWSDTAIEVTDLDAFSLNEAFSSRVYEAPPPSWCV